MANYNNPNNQQPPRDYDLEEWLHLTGWHNVEQRHERLEKWRDIHFEYEHQRRALMRPTWDGLDQELYNVKHEPEMAGNQALPHQAPGHYHHGALAFRPAPGNNNCFEQQNVPVGPRAGAAAPAGPTAQLTRGRTRERNYRSRSPIRARSPHPVRGRRGNANAGEGNNNNFRNERRFGPQPIRDIELGEDGETRFFMIKSHDSRNIFTCWDDNLWATSSVEKGNVLADAFDTSKNVVLFFSANGSHAIQGYARMIGPPSSNVAKPEWYWNVSQDMSEPFPVEWLSKNVCSDRPMRSLANRMNRDQETGAFMPPNRSRDCQEIDGHCGRAMIEIMKDLATGRADN